MGKRISLLLQCILCVEYWKYEPPFRLELSDILCGREPTCICYDSYYCSLEQNLVIYCMVAANRVSPLSPVWTCTPWKGWSLCCRASSASPRGMWQRPSPGWAARWSPSATRRPRLSSATRVGRNCLLLCALQGKWVQIGREWLISHSIILCIFLWWNYLT